VTALESMQAYRTLGLLYPVEHLGFTEGNDMGWFAEFAAILKTVEAAIQANPALAGFEAQVVQYVLSFLGVNGTLPTPAQVNQHAAQLAVKVSA
jgi:hypothetical protein